MQFKPLQISSAFAIEIEPVPDERGAFARIFCAHEFSERGLVSHFLQHSLSCNTRRGTVRGLHFQAHPFLETKLVRCIKGTAFAVLLDLREDQATFGRWCAIELSADARNALYVPRGCASGFQTLVDDCDLEYLISPQYVPEASRGVRWDDPLVGIEWPIKEGVILSERDRALPSIAAIKPHLSLI